MDNPNRLWIQLLKKIYGSGKSVGPRGLQTKELIAHQSIIDMNYPCITLPSREMNYKFMFGEAWWILSGSNKVEPIAQYLENIRKFSDNGLTFNGAYGPKVVEQLQHVINSLAIDPESRQAVLTIWRENPAPSKDIPCTVSMQFLIRNNKLICNVTMRSSDAWLGWVYDIFNFSMISAYIGIALRHSYNPVLHDLELGELYITAGSQHIYECDFDKVENVLNKNSKVNSEKVEEWLDLDLGTYNSSEDLILDLKQEADSYNG